MLPEQNLLNREVFISYSRKNKEFALQLAGALKQHAREVWIDLDAIPPSAEWWAEIKHGIDETHTFIPILTPDLLMSPVCTFEMDYALKHHKRIIPIMRSEAIKAQTFGTIAAIEPSGFLAEILGNDNLLEMARDNWQIVEKLNWINMRETDDFDASLHKLLFAIDTDLARVRLHTHILIQAKEWLARDKDESYLLIGSELREAVTWHTRYGEQEPKATDNQSALIQASLDKEASDDAARQAQIQALNTVSNRARRNRLIATIVGVISVAVALIAWLLTTNSINQLAELQPTLVSGQETLVAVQNRIAENDSLRLGNHAQSVIFNEGDPELALLLAIRAARTARTDIAQQALENAAQGFHTFRILDTEVRDSFLNFSPDARYLLVNNVLWDVFDNQQVRTYHDSSLVERPVTSNAVSPDGQYIIIGYIKRAELWTLDGRLLTQWETTCGSAQSLLFSPDGSSLYIVDECQIAVYRFPSGELLRQFPCCVNAANAHLSPDGNHLLILDGYGSTAYVFDVQSGEKIYEFPPVSTYITSITFSPPMNQWTNYSIRMGKYLPTIASSHNEFIQYDIEQGKLEYYTREGGVYNLTSDGVDLYGLSPTIMGQDNAIVIHYLMRSESLQFTLRMPIPDLHHGGGFAIHAPEIYSTYSKYLAVETGKGLRILTYSRLPDDPAEQLLFACSRVFRDFTPEEREYYEIASNEPTCPAFGSDVEMDGSMVIPFGATPMPTETMFGSTAIPAHTATPSITPTSSLTASPTHTAQAGSLGQIIGNGRVNLRSGPAQSFSIIGTAETGETVEILQENREGTWLYIRAADGLEAWVSAALIQR